MRLALAQLNPLVGDLRGNAEQILAAVQQAEAEGAALVLTPELSSGATPGIATATRPVGSPNGRPRLAASNEGHLFPLVGVALQVDDHRSLACSTESPWWTARLAGGPKQLLPSYDVFDERRYPAKGTAPACCSSPMARDWG